VCVDVRKGHVSSTIIVPAPIASLTKCKYFFTMWIIGSSLVSCSELYVIGSKNEKVNLMKISFGTKYGLTKPTSENGLCNRQGLVEN
jgi:hypothetical protein